MSFSLDWYEKIWEGSDSEVFKKQWSDHVLKVYELGIPPEMIRAYHLKQSQLSERQYKPLEPWKTNTDLCNPDSHIIFRWKRVKWVTCSVLELNPDQVSFGGVDWYFWIRTISRARYVDWVTLKWLERDDPLIQEIETRLQRTWVPIWRWLWVFAIDPINVKVQWVRNWVLDLLITDLGANIRVSMVGHY